MARQPSVYKRISAANVVANAAGAQTKLDRDEAIFVGDTYPSGRTRRRWSARSADGVRWVDARPVADLPDGPQGHTTAHNVHPVVERRVLCPDEVKLGEQPGWVFGHRSPRRRDRRTAAAEVQQLLLHLGDLLLQ